MDPYSGKTYSPAEVAFLPSDIRDRLITVEGTAENVAHLSTAATHYAGATGNRAARRAASKRARQARRANRR